MATLSVPRAPVVVFAGGRRERVSSKSGNVQANGKYVAFTCGLVAGVTQAGVFNPYDRALYLSVKNKVPFLSPENFRGCYQGFLQSIGGRALSGGLYFPLEQLFHSMVPPDGSALANFLAGTGAGATNALIMNPMSALKYKTWSREVNRGMIAEARSMFRKGGFRPFCNGLCPTLLRDVAFGGCYTFLRLQAHEHGLPREHQWAANICAAAVATLVSGPFNLARNIQFGTKSRADAPTVVMILCQLASEVSSKSDFLAKAAHIQKRFRIGWGTARVAFGMAFANQVYDHCMLQFQER